MGSYRIEESPNKRAGCKTKPCKDHNVKIQKGELRLGVWVENERFQSWSYRHWGCVTPKVLANILEAIGEDGEPNFDMLDGFEDLSAENQAKIKEGILKGELDEADKTDHSLLNGEVNEQEQNEVNGSPEKTKDAKTKNKKRSRAESDEEEEVSGKKTKKTKGGATAKKEPTDEKPTKRGRARKTVKEESPEEEAFEDQPAKRSRARKVDEETAGTEKPVKKSKKMAAVVKDERDEEKTCVTDLQEDSQVQLPAKRARGKAASEKPKRGRKKNIADDED